MPENENAFKNLINKNVISKMGETFAEVYPTFDVKRFNKLSLKLSELELKDRVKLLTLGLRTELPLDYKKDTRILKQVLNKKRLSGFELWPISEYISQFGTEHFEDSMELMYLLTQQFTAEFAIRPFLINDPQRTLNKLEEWLEDENVHIRRWISEGTRPLLPWGAKIQSFVKKPETLHLLEALKHDGELYVRKSVANHLNDISKHHPELVIKTLEKWVKSAPKEHLPKIEWIRRHALRTLIKKGHEGALKLMGAGSKAEVEIKGFKLSKAKLKVGESLDFQFEIVSKSKKSQKLIIDYIISYVKANGSLSPKVYKLKTLELEGNAKVSVAKKHSLKKITTMTFYSGKHRLQIQINGKVYDDATFTLLV